jgi:hypothetical protein
MARRPASDQRRDRDVACGPLRVFNPLDVVLLVLSAAAILGIWQLLPRTSRAWLYLSVGLPLAGIVLLPATHICLPPISPDARP